MVCSPPCIDREPGAGRCVDARGDAEILPLVIELFGARSKGRQPSPVPRIASEDVHVHRVSSPFSDGQDDRQTTAANPHRKRHLRRNEQGRHHYDPRHGGENAGRKSERGPRATPKSSRTGPSAICGDPEVSRLEPSVTSAPFLSPSLQSDRYKRSPCPEQRQQPRDFTIFRLAVSSTHGSLACPNALPGATIIRSQARRARRG
jgi:hypothetical protein